MRYGLLRLLYDYRNLLGRRDIVQMPLDHDELRELADLEQRFHWNADATNASSLVPVALRRHFLRLSVNLQGAIKVGGEFRHVQILDIGGGGLSVEPAPDLQRGELTVVRVADPQSTREYHFPAQVVWVQTHGRRARMGLSFFGIPIELRYTGGTRSDDAAA